MCRQCEEKAKSECGGYHALRLNTSCIHVIYASHSPTKILTAGLCTAPCILDHQHLLNVIIIVRRLYRWSNSLTFYIGTNVLKNVLGNDSVRKHLRRLPTLLVNIIS
jgi:hypothetical protein